MVDIDLNVMNMFTQDYGLTAAELTKVTKSSSSSSLYLASSLRYRALKSHEISRENTSFSLIMRHQPVIIVAYWCESV